MEGSARIRYNKFFPGQYPILKSAKNQALDNQEISIHRVQDSKRMSIRQPENSHHPQGEKKVPDENEPSEDGLSKFGHLEF